MPSGTLLYCIHVGAVLPTNLVSFETHPCPAGDRKTLMSTTNNTSAKKAILIREFNNWIADTEFTASSDDVNDQAWASVRLADPVSIWAEMLEFFEGHNLTSDTDAVDQAEAELFPPKETNTDFMSWKHLDEEARQLAESDYRTFFLLHPGQKNPTDVNTDQKWEFIGIVGRKRFAAMQAARKAGLSWTKAKHFSGISKEVA